MLQSIGEILNIATLNIIFIGCLVFGIAYAVILMGVGALGGGDGHADGGHADGGHADGGGADGGHADGSDGGHADGGAAGHPLLFLNLTSPMGIATFITGVGSSGLICLDGFRLSILWSVIGSGVGGLLLNVVVTFSIFQIFVKAQASSIPKSRELHGIEAEVITQIPEQGVGEIAYISKQGRQTAIARSSAKVAIPKGECVIIEKFVGSAAYVRIAGSGASDNKGASPPAGGN